MAKGFVVSQRATSLFDRSARLCGFLLAWHFVLGREQGRGPLTQRELVAKLGPGWSQATVSRAMWQIFPNGGMAQYDSCFRTGTLCHGLVQFLSDGTRLVDAIDDGELSTAT
jgi:hypothetical protein